MLGCKLVVGFDCKFWDVKLGRGYSCRDKLLSCTGKGLACVRSRMCNRGLDRSWIIKVVVEGVSVL